MNLPTNQSFLSLLTALLGLSAMARDLTHIDPPFPRIGNCYHALLADKTWEQGSNYWCKLGLLIGGGYDLHYDWEKASWSQRLLKVEQNLVQLRQVNPHVLALPYVDVVEGPDNPHVPKAWWALKNGERWSGWPGYFRINTKLPEVLQFNLDKVRDEICGRPCFDGVFYDCWGVDDWLVPHTAALRGGQAVVMVNDWNLPRKGFAALNGVLSEDEINRVMDGKVDFEDFLSRYFRWTRETRRPCVTMIVCQPQTIRADAWHWSKVTYKERQAQLEKLRVGDEQTMRFGLATTLMSDGYFGYDAGMAGRGNWWWYKEYDAPLGHPRGPAHRNADGTWQRDYAGGTVVVNGTPYDTVVQLAGKARDVSTGRVGSRFTIPMLDGRIFLPTGDPATETPDLAPRLTRTPPAQLHAVKLPDGKMVLQTPGGLELRFDTAGMLRHILWHGQSLCSGGEPKATKAPAGSSYHPEQVSGELGPVDARSARVAFRGTLTEGEQRVDFVETCTLLPDNRFTLHFEFTAASDLTLRLWRHYFAFPAARYARATARTANQSITLPPEVKDDQLLRASKRVEVETDKELISIDSSLPLTLSDHRRHGTDEYLLAGYPVKGAVKQGTRWTVELTMAVSGK